MSGWLFPMGAGVFTQSRWYWCHSCGWRARTLQGAGRRWQGRTGALMTLERRL